MTLWFATGNAHKRDELRAILPEHEIKLPSDAGIVCAPEETGVTFLDNALLKARTLYALVHEPVVADDSGLCVDCLGGRPDVYSARYGGERGGRLTVSERNALLLREIGDSPLRSARFVCAMALLLDENRLCFVQETLEGEIIRDGARGTGGFGYDPLLYLPERGCTVAELSEAEKNAVSHRGKAGQGIAAVLRLACAERSNF
ncbi:RdgB/HAM1 family non-canonical purine NTP pyrophosphatase [Treponema endosymbiont of Eucomonympha sp.]|uniref:RdgB/HAM1 family non-canonical purine NTP pyrophosphatase n=2 Tax=Treponema endosymbiont of Eucomonympha sp. TaxID=1580831 RepID=UPI00075135BC|nr:RdgB/HAM1 family non-canonical purine NTP pyrophosphatase [Treponema endosymbiont of Eucomonympha sp.]